MLMVLTEINVPLGPGKAGEGHSETVAPLPLSYGLKMAFRDLRPIVNYDCTVFRVTWFCCQRQSNMESSPSTSKSRGRKKQRKVRF